MKKKFNSQGFSLVHQHGRRFSVLEQQYGRCDVMWKRSIGIDCFKRVAKGLCVTRDKG